MVVALLGAIVLGGVGGATGVSVETLARTASGADLAQAFRFVFMAAALVLAFGLAFMIAMEERPLRGPAAQQAAASVGNVDAGRARRSREQRRNDYCGRENTVASRN